MEKIQELTDKLYREGVEKGNAEGQRLVEEAKVQAAKIVADAKAQAEQIVADARKDAGNLAANTKSELKLYAGQALSALKTEVANVITANTVNDAVGKLMADKDFLGELMVVMTRNWASGDAPVISTADAEGLKAYFAAHAKDLLDKGVKIEKVNGKSTSFSISPADGSYKVNFGEPEFVAYFKEFLRPQLVEMLF
ncbi:MAG: hypothetical protein NC388_06760 [Clostridium sp.]|nr:hypothetical protein [Clostridium sp.]